MLETLALEHECEQQVERIVAIRAIYQDSVRLDPDTLGYAAGWPSWAARSARCRWSRSSW